MAASLTEILSNVQPLVILKISPFVAANYSNARSFPILALTLMIHRDRSLADPLSAPARRKLEKPGAKNHSSASGASSHFEPLSDGLNSHSRDLIAVEKQEEFKNGDPANLFKLHAFSPSYVSPSFLTPLHTSDCLCFSSSAPFDPEVCCIYVCSLTVLTVPSLV